MNKAQTVPEKCEKASERITFRFTPSERNALIERAGTTNVSAWARQQLLANSKPRANSDD